MYRRSPRWMVATWRSRAAASIKAERPSGYPRQSVGDRQASFRSGMTPTSRPRPLRPTAPQCTHRPPRPAGAPCALFAWLGLWFGPSGPQRPPAAAREAARCRETLNSSAPSRSVLPIGPPSILARSPSNNIGASVDHPATRRADTRRHHHAVRPDSPTTPVWPIVCGHRRFAFLLRRHKGCSQMYTRRFGVRKSFPGSGLRARLL